MPLVLRITGFLASLLLTLVAYVLILHPDWFHIDNQVAIIVIFILAVLQGLVQLVCFIHLWREKGPLWNLYVFLSTMMILFIIVFFSIWIMDHLNENMMFYH